MNYSSLNFVTVFRFGSFSFGFLLWDQVWLTLLPFSKTLYFSFWYSVLFLNFVGMTMLTVSFVFLVSAVLPLVVVIFFQCFSFPLFCLHLSFCVPPTLTHSCFSFLFFFSIFQCLLVSVLTISCSGFGFLPVYSSSPDTAPV